jgi:hypothetical protein
MSAPAAAGRSVRLAVDGSVLNPFVGDAYCMLVYGSRDGHAHSAFNEFMATTASPTVAFGGEYHFIDASPPAHLVFMVFVTRRQSEGLTTQSLLCTGSVPFEPTGQKQLELVDVQKRVQARLRVVITSTGARSSTVRRSFSDASNAKQDVLRAYEAITRQAVDINTLLYYVRTPAARDIAVVQFIASLGESILPRRTLGHDSVRADSLLSHLYDVAAANIGLSPGAFPSAPYHVQANFVSELIMLLPRALLYQNDSVRLNSSPRISDDSSNSRSCDQWAHALSFPNLERAVIDCEDSAIMALQIAYVLQHAVFRTPKLTALQAFLRNFTPCFAFGSLVAPLRGLVPHAYAVLVDRNFFAAAGGRPSRQGILLEGTARINGCVGGSGPSTDDLKTSRAFQIFEDIIEELGQRSDFCYKHAIRRFAPIERAQQLAVYGPVYALVTAQQHVVVRSNASSTQVGASLWDILAGNTSKYHLTRAAVLSERDQEAAEWDLPRCDIPEAPSAAGSNNNNNNAAAARFHLDVHAETFAEQRLCILETARAVAKQHGCRSVTEHVTPLTSTLSVTQLRFDLQ